MIAVLLKCVDLRVEIDPLTGEPAPVAAERAFGASPADRSALEVALQLAEPGEEVVAVTAATPDDHAACESRVREALASGATRAIRIEIAAGAGSGQVAAVLAPPVSGARFVLCGDASLDRGSGAVPAFVAAALGCAQALGLTSLAVEDGTGSGTDSVLVERRLDGGRRERLRVAAPAVLSVQSGPRLRRAALAAVLAAREARIEVRQLPVGEHGEVHERLRPFRAPAGPLAGPPGADPRDRVLALSGMLVPARARRVVEADAATCADELLNYLSEHGYR
jgi:electron transfer flavoprotein beta subunit